MKTERIGQLITATALAVVLILALPVVGYFLRNGIALKAIFFFIVGPSWSAVLLMSLVSFFPKFDKWVERTLDRLINRK